MDRCLVCGGVATLLCDYVLGAVIGGVTDSPRPRTVIDCKQMPYRCDMPLCRSCATHAGNFFFSGPDCGGTDSIDYCPIHRSSDTHMPEPITPDHADSLRREAWALILRGKMRSVGTAKGADHA